MVGSPLLSSLPRPIVNDEYTIAIHAVDNRLGYRCSRLDGAYATNMFENGSKRFAHRAIDKVFAYPVAYAVDAGLLAHACYNNLLDVVFLAKNRLVAPFVYVCRRVGLLA